MVTAHGQKPGDPSSLASREHARSWAPAWLRDNRNLILFCALMLTIVMLPAFEHSERGELLFAVMSMFITFVSVVVNGRSRSLFWIAFVLAGPAVVLRAVAFLNDSTPILLWSWGLSAAVLVATMLRLLGTCSRRARCHAI